MAGLPTGLRIEDILSSWPREALSFSQQQIRSLPGDQQVALAAAIPVCLMAIYCVCTVVRSLCVFLTPLAMLSPVAVLAPRLKKNALARTAVLVSYLGLISIASGLSFVYVPFYLFAEGFAQLVLTPLYFCSNAAPLVCVLVVLTPVYLSTHRSAAAAIEEASETLECGPNPATHTTAPDDSTAVPSPCPLYDGEISETTHLLHHKSRSPKEPSSTPTPEPERDLRMNSHRLGSLGAPQLTSKRVM